MLLAKRDFKKLRSTQAPEGDHNSNWAISYGDMVTLLLTFFILFFSISKNSNEIRIVQKEISQHYNQENWPKPDVTWGKGRYPTSEMTDFDRSKDLKTTIQGNKLIVEFPKVSFFTTGSFQLTSAGERALEDFGNIFKKFTGQMRLVVRGYTDSRPVKLTKWKPYKDNLELSSLRAISALRSLNAAGVPFDLLRIGGYGETDKSGTISKEEISKFDRKIVLVIEPLDQTERGIRKTASEGVSRENAR